jgi:UrcA family protein
VTRLRDEVPLMRSLSVAHFLRGEIRRDDDATDTGDEDMKAQTLQTHILGTMIALAGTFGLALSAHAADSARSVFPAVIVRYGDLNIDTQAGARTLYARLGHAAERACGGKPQSIDLPRFQRFAVCYDYALDRAVEKIDKPQLQALHAARRLETRMT